MIDAFLISFRLRIECRVNGTLRILRHVPLLKRLLPGDVYAKSWIKVIVMVFAGFGELFSFFFGKIIYLGLMIALPCILLTKDAVPARPAGPMALNIFFFLTLIGAFLRNTLFDPSDEMSYAVFLMRMDARKYALSNYIYFLIKTLLGFIIVIGLFNALIPGLSLSPLLVLLLPLYNAGAKICASAFQIWFFRRRGALFSGDTEGTGKLMLAIILLLLLAAYVPAIAFGRGIPASFAAAFCVVFVLGGAACMVFLLHAGDYRRILKSVELKNRPSGEAEKGAVLNKAVKEGMLQKISEDAPSSDAERFAGKRGFAYFNALFVRRHRKLLTRAASRLAVILAVLMVLAAAACRFVPGVGAEINGRILGFLPIFLFVLYFINRGETITQAMFFNCDSSMMNYNFYRRPDVILGIFTERLKTLVKINLMPSGAVAIGLPLIYFASGGTERPAEYLIMFVTVIAMSVFFSVHYLAMYYLLQPYTEGLAQKGVAYRIVMTLTYAVCYACMQIKALRENALLFGIIVCVFAVVYAAVALALTYKLAPKTFRLRR